MADKTYLGNDKLKSAGVKIEYTQEQVDEIKKCSEDVIYFIKNYAHIVHVDRGMIKFNLYDYQTNLINHIDDNRFTVLLCGRQQGKSETTIAYILWYVLFNDYKNCGILANKAKTENLLLNRLKRSYELLPKWLQCGVVEWNKTSIELENGSKVFAAPTSASGIRGDSLSLLFLDEFALVPNNISDEFFASGWPTISSGGETKVVISSTPKGYNLFWKIWTEAVEGINGFKPFKVEWHETPGRNEAWLKEQLNILKEVKFNAEVLCHFQGSTNTLIPSAIIGCQSIIQPIKENDNLKIFKDPIKDHSYISIVDTARGVEGDYSVIVTIDVTEIPYQVVSVYKDNTISPYAFPQVVYQMALSYNESYILVELNDAGGEVANILYRTYEYMNMFISVKAKDELSYSLNKTKEVGLRTTSKVKMLGCSLLKTILENEQLIVSDTNIISELGTFVKKGNSYAADTGYHDDLVMCLVLFSWLTQQKIFKNLTDCDTRGILFKSQLESIGESLLPFGFSDGINNTVIQDIPNEVKMNKDIAWMFDERLQSNYREEEY